MMTSTWNCLAASGLFVSLGAACGGAGSASDRSLDGGAHADGAGTADGGGTADGSSADGGNATDGETIHPEGGSATQAVNLGTAGNYVVLAMSGISTVPTSAVTGNLGVSPATASAITGFSPLAMDGTGQFSTCSQVIGSVYAADYATPTPSNLTTAIGDMGLAFTDAAGRAPNVTGLGAGNIGGLTLAAGVYQWSTGLLIPTSVTLSGSSSDVWIFQIAQNLTMSNGTSIVLAGGALPRNIFWQVSGLAALGTTVQFEGVVLSQNDITLATGATVTGRLLAQKAVTMESSTVTQPAP
jgi:hypothetical protein